MNPKLSNLDIPEIKAAAAEWAKASSQIEKITLHRFKPAKIQREEGPFYAIIIWVASGIDVNIAPWMELSKRRVGMDKLYKEQVRKQYITQDGTLDEEQVSKHPMYGLWNLFWKLSAKESKEREGFYCFYRDGFERSDPRFDWLVLLFNIGDEDIFEHATKDETIYDELDNTETGRAVLFSRKAVVRQEDATTTQTPMCVKSYVPEMKNNNLATFPRLNLGCLKDRAERWVVDHPDVPIESITLYRYASVYAKKRPGKQHPAKYALVFGIKDEVPRKYDPYQAILDIGINNIPERAWLKEEPPLLLSKEGIPYRRPLSDIERAEARINREQCEALLAEQGKCSPKYDPDSRRGAADTSPIDSLIESYHTIKNQDSFLSLMDADFSDVYLDDPSKHFKEEWTVFTRCSAEGNRCIKWREAYWVLFDVMDQTKIPQQIQGLPGKGPAQQEDRTPEQSKIVNFFTRGKDKHWRVGFNGEEGTIDPLGGVHYIAILLQEPGASRSCRYLYQAVAGKMPVETMSESAAIGEGLNIGSSKQAASDYKAKQKYIEQYQNLSDEMNRLEDNPEGDTMRKEIESEMEAIIPFLKEKTIPDKDTANCQSAVRRALDRAFVAIHEAGLKDLEKHLQDYIKTDGAFGLSYTGTVEWKITVYNN